MNASLKIGRTLKARGHRVFHFGLEDFEDYITSQGLEFMPAMADYFPKGFLTRHSFNISTFEVLLSMLSKELKDRSLTAFDVLKKEADSLIEKLRPDLVVSDVLLADLAFLIYSSGVPITLLSTILFYPWVTEKAVTNAFKHITTMFLCPQEFDFPYKKKRVVDHYVEASIDLERKEVEFSFDQLDVDKRLIYCSLGSQTHLYARGKGLLQTVIDAMWEKKDCQMILSTGSTIDPTDFPSVPPNVFPVKTAPQLQVLKRASLMITHGGLNSIKECIFFGVPMIVFSLLRDQPLNAARVAYHGLGLRGNPDTFNATELLGMMDKIDGDPAFKARVEKMGKRFREIEESQISIEIIEKALNSFPRGFERKLAVLALNS